MPVNLTLLLFGDGKVLISNTEDNLQKAFNKFIQITKDYNLAILAQKSKVMAFKGPDPIQSRQLGS